MDRDSDSCALELAGIFGELAWLVDDRALFLEIDLLLGSAFNSRSWHGHTLSRQTPCKQEKINLETQDGSDVLLN